MADLISRSNRSLMYGNQNQCLLLRLSGFPIAIWRKEKTLRQLLNNTQHNTTCDQGCNIEKCNTHNSVYQFSCTCSALYYGSSKRSLHARINEHLHPAPSQTKTAIHEHIHSCPQNYEIRIKDVGRDCVDARLREAIYINSEKPSLNKRDVLAQWIDQM